MQTQIVSHLGVFGVPLIGCDDRYEDRALAGRQLAARLQRYRGGPGIVLALPPGGVAVAGELARALRLSLDVLVAREFQVPTYPSLVAGGVSEGGGLCFNRAALRLPGVSLATFWREARYARDEVAGLIESYRMGRRLLTFGRRPVILVDDGLGSGMAQLAALQALRHFRAQSCIVATPVGTKAAVQRVARWADTVVALASVEDELLSGGRHWQQALGDDEAAVLLERCRGCAEAP